MISYGSQTRSGSPPPPFLLRLLDAFMISNILGKFEKIYRADFFQRNDFKCWSLVIKLGLITGGYLYILNLYPLRPMQTGATLLANSTQYFWAQYVTSVCTEPQCWHLIALVAHSLKPVKLLGPCKRTQIVGQQHATML